LIEAGKPVILVFSEPGCGACDELLPAVGQWQREYADALTIVPISRGEVKVNRAKSAEHKLQNMLLQADREIAGAYLVEATPSAVLITDGRIASPLAVGPDMIRALVGRATLPPSVKKGESVPSLRFADLEGKTVDLANLRGRRRLLLFWNPTCGFCQQMLEDVRTWERNPPPEAPELLVISAGTYDGIREQGFRSRVLLDPNFGAGQVFSAAGTPAAVVLDEDGRVASEVGVGAQAVLALAGGRQLN
jgi:thiol-disulfide isomerase/thioredoxin